MPPDSFSIVYDAHLVEQVVLHAAPRLAPEAASSFHAQRERIYEVANLEEREAQFRALFEAWFSRLEFGRPLEMALAEAPGLAEQTRACRVAGAARGRDEGADLFDLKPDVFAGEAERAGDGHLAPPRIVLVRLRPPSLMDGPRLLDLLRHEFLHLIDMLDPAFGYERELAGTSADPARQHLLRTRYRVLWDVTVAGRLRQRGLTASGARERWRNEFYATFAMLGDRMCAQFERWFDVTQPRHQQLVEFARNPLRT